MPSLSAAQETARKLQALGVDVHLGQRLDESIIALAEAVLSVLARLQELEYRLDTPSAARQGISRANSAPT